MRFNERVVMITGAGSGQGRAVAEGFAREGARVALMDLDADGLEATRRRIEAAGGLVLDYAGDVADSAAVQQMVAMTIERFGQIDVLYNNAGVYWADRDGPVDVLAEEVWDRILAINLRGTFLCCKYVLPGMLQRQQGVIINVASVAAFAGDEACHAYPASKSALLALTRSMAQHYGPRGVRVVVIAPGFIDTPMAAPFLADADTREKVIAATMLRRVGQPDDIANVALFLASDQASFVTGSMVVVDGGLMK
jgi:NAD(P)-dependent dehydrogenase (short-subunit alcohol dehydrogenase family)